MAYNNVSYDFMGFNAGDLNTFTMGVVTGFAAHIIELPAPPYSSSEIDDQRAIFMGWVAEMPNIRGSGTVDKNVEGVKLLNMLRANAAYLQLKCNNSLSLILGAGYHANATTDSHPPMVLPIFKNIVRRATGTFKVNILKPAPGTGAVDHWDVEVQAAGGAWVPAGFFKARTKMYVFGLIAGTYYTVRIRGCSGNNVVTDWVEAAPIMSI